MYYSKNIPREKCFSSGYPCRQYNDHTDNLSFKNNRAGVEFHHRYQESRRKDNAVNLRKDSWRKNLRVNLIPRPSSKRFNKNSTSRRGYETAESFGRQLENVDIIDDQLGRFNVIKQVTVGAHEGHEANECNDEIDILQKELAKKNYEIQTITDNIYRLTKELQKSNNKFDEIKSNNAELKRDNAKKKEEIDRLVQQFSQDTRQCILAEIGAGLKGARDQEEIIQSLVQQQAVLVDRLASEMNSKVAASETSLENINIAARPMNIAEEYNILMSNAWLDAKSALDANVGNDGEEAYNVELLFSILQISEELAKKMHHSITNEIAAVLQDPIQWMREIKHDQHSLRKTKDRSSQLPPNVLIALGDQFRNFAQQASITFLAEEICQEVRKIKSTGQNVAAVDQLLVMSEIKAFIVDSARLAWKMTIQRPQMHFDASQKHQQWTEGLSNTLDLAWGSRPKGRNAVIQYYKNPVLLHGDKVMAKGSVFVSD